MRENALPGGSCLSLRFHAPHPIWRLADDHTVVEFDDGLQIAKEQKRPQVYLHTADVTGEFGERQDLDAVQHMRIVVGSVPPVHPGIDRYLNGAPRSSGVLQQVNRHSPTLADNLFRRPLAE